MRSKVKEWDEYEVKFLKSILSQTVVTTLLSFVHMISFTLKPVTHTHTHDLLCTKNDTLKSAFGTHIVSSHIHSYLCPHTWGLIYEAPILKSWSSLSGSPHSLLCPWCSLIMQLLTHNLAACTPQNACFKPLLNSV